MLTYIGRRILGMLLTMWVIITLTFVLMHTVPGSPLNTEQNTNAAVQANMEEHFGLNDPYYIRYFDYLISLAQLDFGPSIKQNPTTVNELISRGFPVSLELGIVALIVAVASGITLGIFAALRRNGVIDYGMMTFAVIGISVPNFILATLLIYQVAGQWRLLPVGTWASWKHMILPALALGTTPMAIIARLTRSSMVEVLTQDYIRTAKAKGLSPFKIVVKHALRNALLPVVTILGTLVAAILTGSFVIEKIFAIPGMGRYFVESINSRDYPVIMGTTIFYSGILMIMLLIVDVIYGILDPRIKLHKKEE